MIHYFLDGSLDFSYEDSWRKYAGHLKHMHWHCDNLPVEEYPILKKLIAEKRYSMLSDFIRWWAVYTYGGIYLDYDVELIAPIDDLLSLESFVCIEGYPIYPNGAASGGKKGNKYHKEIIQWYLDVVEGRVYYDVRVEVACSPWMLKRYVQHLKGAELDESDLTEIKTYGDFVTLPKEYFFPYNWNEKYSEDCITKNTHGIHWWKHSWK